MEHSKTVNREENLLERINNQDVTVIDELIKIYGNNVLNTCYKFLLNKEDAEDISQEVFIEIYHSLSSFKGNSKISTWIYRIAVSKSIDELRKRKQKKRITTLGKLLQIEKLTSLLLGDSFADKKLLEDENFKEIETALSALPENQRIVFTLSKIDGLSNAEIADIMNITTYSVESLNYRAKKKITNKLLTILKD